MMMGGPSQQMIPPPPVGAVPAAPPSGPPPPATSGGGGAGGNPEAAISSSLPPPPLQYIKMYTDEAVSRGVAPPPPPPFLNEPYHMFGVPFQPMNSTEDSIVQSLESQGFRRLYSAKDIDRKKELRKLNHSILVNFLDLMDILIKCPESPKREEKLEDINLLFIHMHHLINEFRPHQARETLRVMLHVQKRKRVQVADKFQSNLDKIQESIQQALESLPDIEEVTAMDTGSVDEGTKNTNSINNTGIKIEHCNNLDTLMCDIVDGISPD